MADQQMVPYEQRFDADGLDLVASVDNGKAPHYPTLQNVRQIRRGEFRCRPALNAYVTAPAAATPWHSVRRLNDKQTGQYALISGIGTSLYATAAAAAASTPGAISVIDTTYSGNPLSLLPFKPENDIAEWMAVADANKMRKVNYAGTVHQLGLPQPTRPPDVGLDWATGLQRLDIEMGNSLTGWAVSSPGAIAAALTTRTNAACAVTGIVQWGEGPTLGIGYGWLSAEVGAGPPNGLANIGPGTVLSYGAGADTLTVEEIHPPTPTPNTTIKRIQFDNGAGTGYCTVVPVTSYREFQQHSIVVTTGGSAARGVVTNVIKGPDNTIALRVYFSSGAPVVGDTIAAVSTVYGFTSTTTAPVAGNAFVSKGVTYAALVTPSVIYTLTKVPATALNLSAFANGKQVDQTLDEMHVSLQASDWTAVDSVKIQLDVDDGSFNKNFFSHTVRQADLLAFQTNTLSAIDTRSVVTRNDQLDNQNTTEGRTRVGAGVNRESGDRINRDDNDRPVYSPGPNKPSGPQPDEPGGSSSQGTTGTNQWSEIRFKLSDLVANRFGADLSKGLQNVNALRIIVTRTASATSPDISIGSWWIGGGSAPDVGLNAPYEYRYRYRASLTGARSNWSPAGYVQAWPHRVPVYVVAYNDATFGSPVVPAEVDKIDIQRRGGTVNNWVTIGTVQNSGTNPVWVDTVDDLYAVGAARDPLSLEGNVNDQPFTTQQASFVTTATSVAGTFVYQAGGFTSFFAAGTCILQPGTGAIVGGISTIIRRVVSNDLLEVYDNCGSGASVRVEIPSPYFVNQPMPIVFGDIDGWYMGIGDRRNPGRLYVFNRNTMDSAPGNYYVDITNPGEPLQNGCVFNGRGYLWSTESMFVLTIDGSLPDAPVRFERLTTSVGMFSRYALAVGQSMCWLGKDGIYTSDGGATSNLTTGVLAPLFPTDGHDGVTTNGIPAPAMTIANAAADGIALHQFRLSFTYDHMLWFDYVDAANVRRSLGMSRAAGRGVTFATGQQAQHGWWYDTYANGALFHYSGEGENLRQILCGGTSATSKLYLMGPSTNGDDGTAIACQVRSFAFTADYPRTLKDFTDAVCDVDPGTSSVAVSLLFDNYVTTITPTASPLTGAGRVQTILDINGGAGQYARNIAIDFAWSITATDTTTIYRWGGSLLMRPDDTIKRATDFTDAGYWGPKEFRGCDIECSASSYTLGAANVTAKTLMFDYTKDDGTVGTISIAVSVREKSIVPVVFPTPFIGYEIRIHPSDANTWKEYEVKKWHYDELSDLTALISPWEGGERLEYVQGIEIYADTGGAAILVNVQRDFGAVGSSFTATHNGRGWKSYSFAAPFLAYLRRLVPAGPIRMMKWRWAAQPEAPLGDVWEAQEIEFGDPFGFAQYAEIEYASTSIVTLRYTIDGVLALTDATALTSTGGTDPAVFRKVTVVLPAAKGRLCKVRLDSSSQFRIREKGSGVYTKATGDKGGLQFKSLIGAVHRDQGALL